MVTPLFLNWYVEINFRDCCLLKNKRPHFAFAVAIM